MTKAAKKVAKKAAKSRTRRAHTSKKAAKPKLAAAGLTHKQQVFVDEYFANGFNATQAARTAGYSARTAESQGSRLLKNVKVAELVDERKKAAAVKREITADRVLDEIAKLAFFDPRRLYNAYGSLIPVHQLEEDVAAAISGVEVKELYDEGAAIGELKKIKFADKGQNLERLGRHLRLFERERGSAEEPFVVRMESILGGGGK